MFAQGLILLQAAHASLPNHLNHANTRTKTELSVIHLGSDDPVNSWPITSDNYGIASENQMSNLDVWFRQGGRPASSWEIDEPYGWKPRGQRG
jgi:hypothetical protein